MTPLNNPLKKVIIKTQTQETAEHPYSIITTGKTADSPRPTANSPRFSPQSVIPYPPIRVKRKYTQRKQNKLTQTLLSYSGFITHRFALNTNKTCSTESTTTRNVELLYFSKLLKTTNKTEAQETEDQPY